MHALLTVHYHKNPPVSHFNPTYANLLRSKITQHDKFTNAGNLRKTFSSEKCIEKKQYICYQRQKTLRISIACVQTRHTIRVTKHMQVNKFLTVQEEPLL